MFNNLGNLAELMRNAGKIREGVEKASEALGQVVVEGTAGGGAVSLGGGPRTPADNSTQTIPVAIASLQGDRLMDAPTINAGALISLLPAVVFFLIFQRTLTRGITAGAVK